MNLALVPLYALILPFLLWPIELFLPYPHIIEEIAKGLIIFFVIKGKGSFSKKLFLSVLVGLLFTASESVLYLFNIYALGNLSTLLSRFLLTGSLHVITSLAIFLSAVKEKRLIILGVIAAIIIHYYFNLNVQLL